MRNPARTLQVVTLVIGLAAACACSRPEPAGGRPYTPVFRKAAEAAREQPPGTIAAAFAEAAAAGTLDEAARRWQAFLKRYPPDGETEDAVQKRYMDAARYELIRIYYLSGKPADGDKLLEEADPLGLGK